MMRRRRPLLRAAVVGGGAYAVGRRSAASSASQAKQESDQNTRIDSLEQQQAPGAQAVPQPGGPPLLEQLNQLDSLHKQGALTEPEFAAAKAKLLGT